MTGPPVILCCGEALIDMIPAVTDDGARAFRPVAGGAALNCAVALARQEVPVGFVGGLSRDDMGAWLTNAMADEGVDVTLAHRSALPCPLSLVTLHEGDARYAIYDTATAGRAYSIADLPARIPASVAALVLGGISLIDAPSADAFERLAQGADTRVLCLDVNVRPALVRDAPGYRDRLRRMMALADLIKVSDEDLTWLGPDDPWTHAPDALILHSRGAAGAVATKGSMRVAIGAPEVDVLDTVGAGDILMAGCLAALWRSGALQKPLSVDHDTLLAALTHGVQTASLSVARAGADAPTRREMSCAP